MGGYQALVRKTWPMSDMVAGYSAHCELRRVCLDSLVQVMSGNDAADDVRQ